MDGGEKSRLVSRAGNGGARFDAAGRQSSRRRELCFLEAWKRAIRSAGLRYFVIRGPHSLELAAHRDQLLPDYQAIKHALSQSLPMDEGLFLCALYSVYNPDEGLRLARRHYPQCRTRDQIVALLGAERRLILDALLAHYTDW